MRLVRAASLLAGLALFAGKGAASAQQTAAVPPREQVHPELVDTTWGPRTTAAWQLAFAHRWDDARARFTELHTAHPAGLEAMLGLGFVARATGRADEARQWYRRAYAVEPSEMVRTQLEAVELDRASIIDISGGAERVGSTTTADWSISALLPVDRWLAVTARAGVVGAGDPLRGVLLDSTAGSPARVLSVGTVARPTDDLTLTARFEYWSSAGEGQTFVWFDGTQRVSDHLAIRLGARPLAGSTGAPQVTGGADVIFVPGQVLS
ncbi:MAG TPA: tetratricopeptide repeat protein, partial [Gemmatimonadaceae bacterium]|nr:tetratricopeptide repeat protein [Gemmatimonadaceae bacterium]